MKHLEESHKHLEDEHELDTQLQREFEEKQEMEERRELCLALQMDSECLQPRKPLTKVEILTTYSTKVSHINTMCNIFLPLQNGTLSRNVYMV